MQGKVFPQIVSGLVCAVLFFLCGGAAGWWILIAPSEGPKDVLDVNNIEILLICGLIPSLLGAAIGVFVCRLIEGANERDLYK